MTKVKYLEVSWKSLSDQLGGCKIYMRSEFQRWTGVADATAQSALHACSEGGVAPSPSADVNSSMSVSAIIPPERSDRMPVRLAGLALT